MTHGVTLENLVVDNSQRNLGSLYDVRIWIYIGLPYVQLCRLSCSMAESQSDYISAIVSTMNFAAIKHKDQKRKDPEGTPYINHPIGKWPIFIYCVVSYCVKLR